MDIEELIPITQEKLGSIFKKPKLTPKLLKKPPFRFLFDVIFAVIQETGFLADLYSAEESDIGNINSKDDKMAFLDKLIGAVEARQSLPVHVRSKKVVAGLEPENTNILLQAIGDLAVRGEEGKEERKGYDEKEKESSSSHQPTLDEIMPVPESKEQGGHEEGLSKPFFEEKKQLPERAVSRQGRRDRSAGLEMPKALPDNLTALLEGCDGSYERTQELLQDLIGRPKLKEELLSKPPFRFLHDIVSNLIANTGFGQGLYEDTELDSKNVKGKEAKIGFLEKIVALVGRQLNTMVDLRPQKVVSGHDADKTNKFLQYMAIAARHLPDTTDNVRTILGESQAEGKGGEEEAPSSFSEPEEKKSVPIEEAKGSHFSQEATIGGGILAPPSSPQEYRGRKESVQESKGTRDQEEDDDEEEEETFLKAHATSSVDPVQESKGPSQQGPVLGAKRSMRPSTARRRPPKTQEEKEREVEQKEREKAREGKRKESGSVKILREGDDDDEDDEDAGAEEKEELDNLGNLGRQSASDIQRAGDGVHGKLVMDIMRQEEEDDDEDEDEEGKGNEKEGEGSAEQKAGEGEGGIRFGRVRVAKQEKARQRANSSSSSYFLDPEELVKLREAVQQVVKSTSPLAKCFDFVSEDLVSMSRELTKWREENTSLSHQLDQEERKTQELMQPLVNEVTGIDEQIRLANERVNGMRAQIARNDETLRNLCALRK